MYTHVESNAFKAHPHRAYSTNAMLSLLPKNVNAIKRRIRYMSHKFMIKIKRFSSSRKSSAIIYK